MHSLYIQVCCGNNCMLFLLTIIVEDRQMHGVLPHHILPACHAWSAALFRRLVGPLNTTRPERLLHLRCILHTRQSVLLRSTESCESKAVQG